MKQTGTNDALRKNDLRFRVQTQNPDEYHEDEYEDISEIDEKDLENLNRELA